MWLSCSLGPSCLSCLLTLDLNSEAPQHNRVACFFLTSRSCCFQTWCDLLPGARQRALDGGGSGGRRPVPRWVRHVWEERGQCGWLPSGLMRRQGALSRSSPSAKLEHPRLSPGPLLCTSAPRDLLQGRAIHAVPTCAGWGGATGHGNLNSLWVNTFFFFLFWLCLQACGIFVPRLDIAPRPSAVKARKS